MKVSVGRSVAPMSALGHLLPRRLTATVSALPSKAAAALADLRVRFGPRAEMVFAVRAHTTAHRAIHRGYLAHAFHAVSELPKLADGRRTATLPPRVASVCPELPRSTMRPPFRQ